MIKKLLNFIFSFTCFLPSSYSKTNNSEVVFAVTSMNFEKTKSLLKNGANANATDYRGQPILFIATASNQFRIANLLVDHGANIWWADDFGATPSGMAHVTEKLKNTSTIELEALTVFIDKIKKQGQDWPPPPPKKIIELINSKKWKPVQK